MLPIVSLAATPTTSVGCYTVTEILPPGASPYAISAGGIWNSTNSTIYWGPYFDHQSRTLTYGIIGTTGTYPLTAEGTCDGYIVGTSGAESATINSSYSGPSMDYTACTIGPLHYSVSINPALGLVTVDTAVGTIDWGDGTQSAITQPSMTLSKRYASGGTYSISTSVHWTGHTTNLNLAGTASKSDTVTVLSACDVPSISSQPTNQVVPIGGVAQFAVSVLGTPPLTYQWYFNATNPISGGNGPSFSLTNVGVSQAGSYSVQITNPAGSVTSQAATLTVQSSTLGITTSTDIPLMGPWQILWMATGLAGIGRMALRRRKKGD